MLSRARNRVGTLWQAARAAAGRGLGRLKGRGRLAGRAGYYAALAALLAVLGAASQAYRGGGAGPAPVPTSRPQAALALVTPAPAPSATPEPTPASSRFVWPVEGEVIAGFSGEDLAWSETLGQWQAHEGVDIAGAPGEAVYACADGTVLDAWRDPLWGNVIAIAHEGGWESVYAGLNTLELTRPGDPVAAGDVISAVGVTAACESGLPGHLHFELRRDGVPVDFAALMAEQGL